MAYCYNGPLQLKRTNYNYMNNLNNKWIKNDVVQKQQANRLHVMLFHLIKFNRKGKTKQHIV